MVLVTEATGIVTNWLDGYGFVTTTDVPDDVGHDEDVFLHISDYRGHAPQEGYRLEFDIVEGEKGLKAQSATLVSKNPIDGEPEGWGNRANKPTPETNETSTGTVERKRDDDGEGSLYDQSDLV